MTEQQQREACAELARRVKGNAGLAQAIGYQLRLTVDNLPDAHVIAPDGRRLSLSELPDYFTDAAASWELVVWLAADDARWFVFIRQLIKLINWPVQFPHDVADATFAEIASEVRYLMTAPPSVIARAACKALGIEVSE